MTDFTDHVGAALATRDEDDREDWEPPARADDRPTPSGPYSCLHRGHGLCGDCPSDEPVDVEPAAIAAVEAAGERDEALDALSALLCAFPQLAAGYSTSEQQAALRQARTVCERHGRPTRNPVSRATALQRQP